MRLSHDRYTIHLRVPFAIARGTTAAYDRVRLILRDDAGNEGWGEAAPNSFYGETPETVEAAVPRLRAALERAKSPESLEDAAALEDLLRAAVPGDASARSAVSAAAHDLLGKKAGSPVWKLFGLEAMSAPPTSYTIGIPADEPELRRRVEEAHRYPILKIKLGSSNDEWIVRSVRRAAPTKLLRADANAAWDRETAARMVKLLAEQGFELIEQPLPRDDIDGLRRLTRSTPIPVIADESCHTARDVAALAGAVHGINIKLSKCGGLAEARRMAVDARSLGMRVMIGCMIESSLGITAAAHLAPLAQFADLDGAALLTDDPYVGVRIDEGWVRLTEAPGLGVTRRT